MRIKEESELIEGEVVEVEVDRPASGQAAKTVGGGLGGAHGCDVVCGVGCVWRTCRRLALTVTPPAVPMHVHVSA